MATTTAIAQHQGYLSQYLLGKQQEAQNNEWQWRSIVLGSVSIATYKLLPERVGGGPFAAVHSAFERADVLPCQIYMAISTTLAYMMQVIIG
jgi:hypothetical protein